MADDDLGAALTGALDLSPTARSALLSFGLQAMQPQAIGQTMMGHLGQAVGAAGETVTRQEQMDLQEQEKLRRMQAVQDKLDIARMAQDTRDRNADTREQSLGVRERVAEQIAKLRERGLDLREADIKDRSGDRKRRLNQGDRSLDQGDTRLGIGQQNADTRETNSERQRGGITDAMRQRDLIKQQDNYEREIKKEAAQIYKDANDIITGERGPYASWRGKSRAEIEAGLKSQKPFSAQQRYAPAPPATPDDDEDEDPNDTTVQAPKPPPAQAGPYTPPPVPSNRAAPPMPTAPQPTAPLTTTGAIPSGAINALLRDPTLQAQFDAKYGAGSADRIRNSIAR
jgi:hypothetical protein